MMEPRSWSVTLWIVVVCLAGVLTKPHDLTLSCQESCDHSGEIVTCDIKLGNKCVGRSYLLCRMRNGKCTWQTVTSSCTADTAKDCMEMAAAQKTDRTVEKNAKTEEISDGEGVMRKNYFGGGTRSTRATYTSSSGDGHAYSYDGTTLSQSHYGLPSTADTADMIMSWPYSIIPGFSSSYYPTGYNRPSQSPYGQSYPQSQYSYVTGGGGDQYSSSQRPASSYSYSTSSANPFYSKFWSGRGKDLFQSMGLPNPFELLSYLPIG